jgi:hypothetical protein
MLYKTFLLFGRWQMNKLRHYTFTSYVEYSWGRMIPSPPPPKFYQQTSGTQHAVRCGSLLHWHGAHRKRKSVDARSLERQTTVCAATLLHRLALALDRTSLSMTSRTYKTTCSKFRRSALTLQRIGHKQGQNLYVKTQLLFSLSLSLSSCHQSRFPTFECFKLSSISQCSIPRCCIQDSRWLLLPSF